MGNNKINIAFRIALIFMLVSIMISCEKSFLNPQKSTLTKTVLYDVMKENYLWYDTIPQVNPDEYPSLQSLLDAITLKPLDKWSSVMSSEEYYRLNENEEYIGHGFGLVDDPDGKLWIGFVYDGSSAGASGVSRGWQVLSINGIAPSPEIDLDTLLGKVEVGVEDTFQFRNLVGGTTSMTLAKEIIDINSVLYSSILDVDGKKAGYCVYQNFMFSSMDELDEIFMDFQDNNVSEVIIDLRYNPGGQMNVAQHLASLIAGTKAIKGTFVKFIYNDKKSDRNISKPFLELDNTLTTTPERVFYITTNKSASASEALINGMSPYLDTYIVGDDTYGKPVGSISAIFTDSTLIPVMYSFYNRLDEGEYYNGLTADSYVEENIKVDFGDPEEKMLKEVLYFIENETWTGSGSKKSVRKNWLKIRGITSLTGAI